MALDKVASDIVDSAKIESAKRIQDAENERSRIMLEADQKIQKLQKGGEKELQDTLDRMRRQELSSAELESKKIVLNVKEILLGKTFGEVLSELSSMEPKEKSAIYKKMVVEGKKILHKPKIYCPKGEAILLSGIRGLDHPIETDMESGLILESEDGSVRLDFRFKTILEGIWDSELKNISKILFE